MPLTLPIENVIPSLQKGCLYVVATPIGNLNDITLRAAAVLANVDLVAAEDTRAAARLLSHYGIKNRLISCHEHNEDQRTFKLIELIKSGQTIALVSNAGTPTISDPGYRLVNAAVAQDIPVVPLPGPCAAVTALSASGLPTDSYLFIGFPPRKSGKQIQLLKTLAEEPRTLIFYESPRRLLALLQNIQTIMGDRRAVVTRELTKIHEEFLRGRLSEIHLRLLKRKEIKGECTLLIHGAAEVTRLSTEDLAEEIKRGLLDGKTPLTELSKEIAKKYGLTKKKVYDTALQLKKDFKF